MQTETKNLLEAALEYYRRGFHVIPVQDKEPAWQYWPHGEKYKDETEEDIRRWFGGSLPVTGVGLRLHGLVALDIDTYNGQEVGELCDGAGAVVQGRGVTALWKLPRGITLKTNDKCKNCLVIAGGNSYIVAPPSVHLKIGRLRTWKVGTGPWDAIELPERLLRILRQDKSGPDVSRHAQLRTHAIALRKQGKNEQEIFAGLAEKRSELPVKERAIEDSELFELAQWAYEKVNRITISPLFLRREFVKMYLGRLVYVTDVGRECWRAWDSHCWHEYGVGEFKALVLHCVDTARTTAGTEEYKPYWASSLINWAPGEKALHVREEIFDKQLDALCCKNVVWTPLGTREPQPEDYCTRYTDVNYIPERVHVVSTRWGRFLADTCAGQKGLLEWLQLTTGYSCFGSNPEQVIFFVYGKPDTGKSTFLEAIRSVLGPYATTMRSQTLLRGVYTQQNSPEVAALQGRRLVVSSELPEGSNLDTQLLKNLTGDEVISATAKYKAPTQFKPEAKIWIAANDLPKFPCEDLGTKKRVRVVPFENVVPKAKQRRDLHWVFENDEFEREVVLAWMLEGAQRYNELGCLDEPQCVIDSTAAYFAQQDPLQCWFDECCEVATDGIVPFAALRISYDVWAQTNSRRRMSSSAIGSWLAMKGFKKGVKQNQRVWLGFNFP